MDAFNFVFSLFGLVFGLALTEVLAGFARALKRERGVRLGWLTPLLAIFVMMDIASFWSGAWSFRAHIQARYGFLLIGLIVTAVYYLAASIVFPAHGDSQKDFDEHYVAHRRQVFGAIAFCNAIGFAGTQAAFHIAYSPSGAAAVILFYIALATGIATGNRRVNIGLLLFLIALYLWSGILTFFPGFTPFG